MVLDKERTTDSEWNICNNEIDSSFKYSVVRIKKGMTFPILE